MKATAGWAVLPVTRMSAVIPDLWIWASISSLGNGWGLACKRHHPLDQGELFAEEIDPAPDHADIAGNGRGKRGAAHMQLSVPHGIEAQAPDEDPIRKVDIDIEQHRDTRA